MLKDIENFHQKKETESTEKVDIICTICRGRVGYVIPAECELPLDGSMIHPHLGCESWDLPGPHAGVLDPIPFSTATINRTGWLRYPVSVHVAVGVT
jgi:hypothetical protein